MRYRTKKRLQQLLVVLLLPFLLGVAAYLIFLTSTTQQTTTIDKPVQATTDEPTISTDGYTKIKFGALPGNMLLTDNCTALVIHTTRAKTHSALRALEKTVEFRPNEHDLMQDIMQHYDINVLMAKIDVLKEELYYGRLILHDGTTVLDLDAKPTDAINTALRFNAPIYVKDEFLAQHGRNVCE